MKKIILILTLLLSVNMIAQNPEKKERIKSLKISYITDKLELTESEAQKFWPIYNASEDERMMLIKTEKDKHRKISNNMSDEEAKTLLNDLIKCDEEKARLKTDFRKNLLTVLPAKKILLLEKIEEDFRREMLEQFKKRNEENSKN